MASSVLISGPVLLGFAMAFDECYGEPGNGLPPIVTPTAIGGVLLPFACVHCGQVRPEPVSVHASKYRDPIRGHSWCPSCNGRYLLDSKGVPLSNELECSATHAPALINGKSQSKLLPSMSGLELLGCE